MLRYSTEPLAHWHATHGQIEVRFFGRSAPGAPDEALARIEASPPEIAWLKQTHSTTTRRVLSPGQCGAGDALWTERPNLALCVVTADCVPIVCATEGVALAIHAGWRGVADGIVHRALDSLPEGQTPTAAWIGPAIGPCCYEVGSQVADRVAWASDDSVRSDESDQPHVDLPRAVELQLRRAGVEQIHRLDKCTKCHPSLLWSHRGRPDAGRNLTMTWRSGN